MNPKEPHVWRSSITSNCDDFEAAHFQLLNGLPYNGQAANLVGFSVKHEIVLHLHCVKSDRENFSASFAALMPLSSISQVDYAGFTVITRLDVEDILGIYIYIQWC